MSHFLAFPSAECGLALHARLPTDPTAQADLCRAYLAPLCERLQRYFPAVDPDACLTAAEDALLGYLEQPGHFDPERSALAAYLWMLARGDLLNLLRGERRHQRHRDPGIVVELAEVAGNLSGVEDSPLAGLERAEEYARNLATLGRCRQGCSPQEQQVLDLMLADERATAAFAVVLGLTELPQAEQERAVKRCKDRLKKRLQRGDTSHD